MEGTAIINLFTGGGPFNPCNVTKTFQNFKMPIYDTRVKLGRFLNCQWPRLKLSKFRVLPNSNPQLISTGFLKYPLELKKKIS